MRLFLAAACAGLLLLGSAGGFGQEIPGSEIKPPFKLSWNESADRLQHLLTAAKANVVQRRQLDAEREAWDVEGLNQPGLKRAVFYMRRSELVGVELQYVRPDWDEANYNTFMSQVRQSIEQHYGPGRQIVRRTGPEGTVTQTITGYQWNVNNTLLQLFYYSAQDGPNVFRTLSVHYKEL